ncbi:MAG: PfkB family carbohydrate kinase, partial [Paracoccaceae bacterium]|nr:PfkB family carbohydrate kinase [Paracoccaceae bacterium]
MQRGTNYAPDGGASDFDGRVVSLLNHADRRRVLVIGDVILDRYIGGNVERVSPEAPVPVLVMANDNCYLGGAANAAANVVSLGGSAVLIGRRGGNPGNDIAGTTLEELLHKHKIEAAMIGEIGYQTPEKIRYVAKGAHLLRVDRDYKWEVSAAAQASVMDAVTEVIHRCDAVLISDYDKGLITDDLAQFIVTAAQKHDIPTVIDSKNLANISINGALVVTPNSGELSAIRTELGLPQSASQQRTAIDFMRRAGVQAVLGTYGDQGMALFDCEEGDSGETYFIDAIRQDSDIVDVAGAGD